MKGGCKYEENGQCLLTNDYYKKCKKESYIGCDDYEERED